ncbi:rhodanese-like domain-containing protein [Parvularcula oceani]|uniref:rhodanese-like domain-containing protein n=1 Tax=Parvularcula oceani TaxID=1247963 RepID=UPI00068DF030|nr:rhodanese-like domain-containing protein [Parvularcula oceani]
MRIHLAALALLAACSAEPGNATDATPQEAAELIETRDMLVLDVRTPQEHARGAIPGSVNVDWNAEDFREEVARLDRDRPVLLHCESGGRSSKALRVLDELGFEDVTHMESGMRAWREAGLPVSRGG